MGGSFVAVVLARTEASGLVASTENEDPAVVEPVVVAAAVAEVKEASAGCAAAGAVVAAAAGLPGLPDLPVR